MRIYWSVNSVPELAALPRGDRSQAFMSAKAAAWKRLGPWAQVREMVIVGGTALVVGGLVVWATGSGALGGGAGGGVSTALANHRRFVRIRKELLS
jgi:hypothetical protein